MDMGTKVAGYLAKIWLFLHPLPMRYLSVEFLCTVRSEAHFPLYKGSMLRGALGNSLRHAVCMMQGRDCLDCMLSKTCIFPRLFTFAGAPENSHAAPMVPPPFCIEPPQDGICDFAQGDTFHFGLKLFSYATDYLPYFIHAFKLAGQRGMGRGTAEGQGRLTLEDVRQEGISVYDAANERLQQHEEQDLPLPRLGDAGAESALTLELLTPLRFKQANRLATELDFGLLLRLILRRLGSLQALEGKDFRLPPADFSALREAASRMRTAASDVRWRDWRRYSGRQNTSMQLGGLTGRIRYAGPAAAFAEYLDFAVRAHLGKQTSFGLGAVAVTFGSADG